MLLPPSEGAQPPLLTKPLEGYAHEGVDRWGNNVYAEDNPDYLVLKAWAASVSSTPIEGEKEMNP